MMADYSTPKKRYIMRRNEELDAFVCALEYSAASSCIHIFAEDA